MKFMKNAEVFSSMGEKVGSIDRVVIDPKTNEITHIVVDKGLLHSEKVVPLVWVLDASDKRVTLKRTQETIDDLPDFEEMHYVSIGGRKPEESFADSIYWYPPASVWWRGGGIFGQYPAPNYILRTEQNIPSDTVALDEGANVYSRDGEHIGDVEEVLTEDENHIATHIIVSEGFFLKERKMVPTIWIDRVKEFEIHLSIHSDTFENIPEYQPTV